MTSRYFRFLSVFGFALSFAGATARAQDPAADCIVGAHDGFDDADARTAAALVCDAVRYQGVSVSEPKAEEASTAGAVYRVRLDHLGSAAFVSLQKEMPRGKPITARRLKLATLDEVSVVADRLAMAVIKNQSLESTQVVGAVSKDEGKRIEQIRGDFSWGPALEGTVFLGQSFTVTPGFAMRFVYETGNFDVSAAFRIGGSEDNTFEASYAGGEIGAHYLFLDGDVSPFVGGGLELLSLTIDSDSGDSFHGTQFGTGAFLEAGVELLRLHSTHFRGYLRADLPFFTVSDELDWDSEDDVSTGARYVPSLSLGVAVLF